MTDLGALHYFLGINIQCSARGIFLSQQQYALEILDQDSMLNCKPITMPVDTKAKISAHAGDPTPEPSLFRNLAEAPQYLTLTGPDIAYVVQQVCLVMQSSFHHA